MQRNRTFLIAAICAVACLGQTRLGVAGFPAEQELPLDAHGFVESLSSSHRARRLNAHSSRFRSGQTVRMNMVVILVDFDDKPADRATHTADYYQELFFSRGVLSTGSLAEYYLENSGGRLSLDGTVAGWYRMPKAQRVYSGLHFGIGPYPGNSQGLAQDAVRAADADINFALYDNEGADGVSDTIDDDQTVDLVMVIHAGQGGETSASSNTFRSVAWWLPVPEPLDGVAAYEFGLGPEEGGVGIFAHELGHLLGLEDLYDGTGQTSGLGIWSLMSAGWSLNNSKTPAHLDAWSKEQAGFAPVILVSGNLPNVVLDPVEKGGSIYKLPVSSTEYFLVETRKATGFDAFLPGSGLLVYHVDLLQQNNKTPGRYRVAVEQADGLYQLERLLGLASAGDAGDLYDATTPSGGFGRFTTPASRSNSGEETGITVYNIRGPDANGAMTVDFRTLTGSSVLFEGAEPDPGGKAGERFVEAGETFDVVPTLRVEGGTAHAVRVTLFANDPLGEVLSASRVLGDLAPGQYRVEDLAVRASPMITVDPYNLKFRLEADYLDEIKLNRTFSVPVGSFQGFSTDFETGEQGFTHQITRLQKFDLWRMHDEPGNGSLRAWRCSDPGNGFRDRVDSSLLTPYFIIPPDGRLIFDHLVQIPRDAGNTLAAGGFVEISHNDGPWTQITPEEGYDVPYYSLDAQLNGRRIFTGTTQEDVWRTSTLNLSPMTGGARVRFRFFSERIIFEGTGWTVDNVRVQSGETPVRLVALSADREQGGVHIRWRLATDEILTGLRILRAGSSGEPFVLIGDRLPASHEGDYLDVTAGTGEISYRIEATRRDGTGMVLGTIRVGAEGAPAPPRFALYPNPMRDRAVISFRMDRSGTVTLEMFDAGGRRIRAYVPLALGAGEQEIDVDGTDDRGRAVPAGVYFYRMTGPDLLVTRKVVVTR